MDAANEAYRRRFGNLDQIDDYRDPFVRNEQDNSNVPFYENATEAPNAVLRGRRREYREVINIFLRERYKRSIWEMDDEEYETLNEIVEGKLDNYDEEHRKNLPDDHPLRIYSNQRRPITQVEIRLERRNRRPDGPQQPLMAGMLMDNAHNNNNGNQEEEGWTQEDEESMLRNRRPRKYQIREDEVEVGETQDRIPSIQATPIPETPEIRAAQDLALNNNSENTPLAQRQDEIPYVPVPLDTPDETQLEQEQDDIPIEFQTPSFLNTPNEPVVAEPPPPEVEIQEAIQDAQRLPDTPNPTPDAIPPPPEPAQDVPEVEIQQEVHEPGPVRSQNRFSQARMNPLSSSQRQGQERRTDPEGVGSREQMIQNLERMQVQLARSQQEVNRRLNEARGEKKEKSQSNTKETESSSKQQKGKERVERNTPKPAPKPAPRPPLPNVLPFRSAMIWGDGPVPPGFYDTPSSSSSSSSSSNPSAQRNNRYDSQDSSLNELLEWGRGYRGVATDMDIDTERDPLAQAMMGQHVNPNNNAVNSSSVAAPPPRAMDAPAPLYNYNRSFTNASEVERIGTNRNELVQLSAFQAAQAQPNSLLPNYPPAPGPPAPPPGPPPPPPPGPPAPPPGPPPLPRPSSFPQQRVPRAEVVQNLLRPFNPPRQLNPNEAGIMNTEYGNWRYGELQRHCINPPRAKAEVHSEIRNACIAGRIFTPCNRFQRIDRSKEVAKKLFNPRNAANS